MSIETTCPNCLEPFTARDKRNVYCSQRCGKVARQAQWRIGKVVTRHPEVTLPMDADRWDRTCPTCKVRHRVPRHLPRESSVLTVPLNRSQLKALYALAIEFVEAGGGMDTDAIGHIKPDRLSEACEECGRWSPLAFLDWLSPDVERVA